MASAPLHPGVWTPENVEDHLNARYIAVAGLTLMIWTHLTTLDEEMKYIWNNDAGVTFNKALFAVVRYFTTVAFGFHCLTLFLARPSSEICRGVCIAVGATALALIGTCDIILLLRTWAIYNRTRTSLICLVVLLATTHLPTLVLGALWITTLDIGPTTKEFWRVIIPSVIYNTVLSGASMYKIWSYHQTRFKTPLISLLIRDGMAYYAIILTAYLFNGFFLFRERLVAIVVEGRFITWVVAVTCAQLQLNLRTAVYHVPDYVTTYCQQRDLLGAPSGRVESLHRPGIDTLIFGGTATELEHKYGNRSIESEVEQEERHHSRAIGLVTTPVHVPQGMRKKMIAPSLDFNARKQGSLLSQLRRTNSFQGSPSHSSRHTVDISVIPNATDKGRPLSPTSNTHSEPSSRSVTRANTPSARAVRVALGFDSKHNWALAKPIDSSSAAIVPLKLKKQSHNMSQERIPLHDMGGIPSRGGSSLRSRSNSNLQVEVQVECERDEPGMSPAPRSSGYEDAKRSASQDGGIRETRVGVWR